jgi:thiol-disulfide isomerase/thioredoxin
MGNFLNHPSMRPTTVIRAAILTLIAAGTLQTLALADQPVATAKIAEWAASDRGGKADYRELSHGQVVDLDGVLVPGKVTIVDLSSDYCAPCVSLAMYLIKISKAYPQRYAIRRININRPGFVGIDLQSPVSRQFKLEAVPRIVVYGSKVKIADGDAAIKWVTDDVARLDAAAAAAAQ